MHSPIMAVGNGVPAIVCRFAEPTSKGIMWRDIGLGDWLFDRDVAEEAREIPAAVLAMAREAEAAGVNRDVSDLAENVAKRVRSRSAWSWFSQSFCLDLQSCAW
jgi:hypothetical protein